MEGGWGGGTKEEAEPRPLGTPDMGGVGGEPEGSAKVTLLGESERKFRTAKPSSF